MDLPFKRRYIPLPTKDPDIPAEVYKCLFEVQGARNEELSQLRVLAQNGDSGDEGAV